MVNKVCTNCVMDSTVPGIKFDNNGKCDYCKHHEYNESLYPLGLEGREIMKKQVAKIKKKGIGKPYDCIIGVSGGVDSSYTLLLAKRLGLRVLAMHVDNGWNSEFAVKNIEILTKELNIDLETIVLDWEEFRDLQIAFLKASVPDLEIPTDWAIHSNLHKVASKYSVNYVLHGHSFRTEGSAPLYWTYMDGLYIKSVYSKYAKKSLKNYYSMQLLDLMYYKFFKDITWWSPLEFINYDKVQASSILKKEYNWISYTGHHHENYYSRFVHSLIFPQKFGIDYRKVSLSSLVRSKKLSRIDALKELDTQIKVDEHLHNKDIDYVMKKFNLNQQSFDNIFNKKPKTFRDYKTYYDLIILLKPIIAFGLKFNLLPFSRKLRQYID